MESGLTGQSVAADAKAGAKLPYAPPLLTTHGPLLDITGAKKDGSKDGKEGKEGKDAL
jgi:hypothetical protein